MVFMGHVTCVMCHVSCVMIVHRHVHHYGRHLVLEWANEDTSLSELREQTLKRYQQTTATVDRPAKRAKHATGDALDDKTSSFLDSLE